MCSNGGNYRKEDQHEINERMALGWIRTELPRWRLKPTQTVLLTFWNLI